MGLNGTELKGKKFEIIKLLDGSIYTNGIIKDVDDPNSSVQFIYIKDRYGISVIINSNEIVKLKLVGEGK